MALTRKLLAALGIENDKIEEIINAHRETVDALKEERDKYKDDAERLPALEKERDDLKAIASKAEKDPYRVKYEAVKDEFEQFKNDVKSKETAAKKSEAVRGLLREIGIADKRIDAVMRVTDIAGIDLDENGKITTEKELKKELAEEWADFVVTTKEKGAKVPNPPSNDGKTAKTREEIMKIKDTAERQREWAEYLNQQKG